jgi:polar amino acid transport system substrate-binding protein
MTGFRRFATLLAVAGLVLSAGLLSACSSSETLLDKVTKAGVLKVSTDSNYAPQSFKNPDGTWQGFDIDVANEIGKGLGVKVEFIYVDWDLITAGQWSGRWDLSVGSMTITKPREEVLVFSEPYYYTPAQMAATVDSGITTLDGLAGKTVCAATATTYEELQDRPGVRPGPRRRPAGVRGLPHLPHSGRPDDQERDADRQGR